jgi:hypothetical protein
LHPDFVARDLPADVFRLKETRHSVKRVVVQRDGTKQGLLGFQVVRGLPSGLFDPRNRIEWCGLISFRAFRRISHGY